MEFFNENKVVRLRSHLDKYLLAEEDEETIRQSRNSSSHKARWTVEYIPGKPHVICLKSCYNRYLTATQLPYLLGMTGKKVTQTDPLENFDSSTIEWEPIRDGFQVKLRTSEGKFLRANGGTRPWRNTVTHDMPYQKSSTRNWVLWEVEMVDFSELRSSSGLYLSPLSSFSSFEDPLDSPTSPLWSTSTRSFRWSLSFKRGMELFQNAKTVRLRSHHDKYLLAEDDQESVCQDRHGSCKNARWTVECVDYGSNSVIRLKSCYGKYLTATDVPYFLGMTGKKVLQIVPKRLDSLVEWEPIREGHQVKLKTRYGNFLRANGGVPPWRNSITHDIPHRTATQDWILWTVDILEVRPPPPPLSDGSASPALGPKLSKIESNDSFVCSPPKSDGRTIYYYVADDKGNVDDEDAMDEPSFTFKGSSVEELTQKLEEETGVEDIIACTRSSLNGKLYPLRLQLPPNNATMHVIVIKSSSKAAREFANPELP